MCGNNRFLALLAPLFALVALALPVGAAEVRDLGAHRFRGMDEFQRVIENKCTVCHTRERVDIAIRKRRNLEKLEKQMIARGAELTERDKRVLGTFWGQPLKSGSKPAPESASVSEQDYREYRRIIETRCTLCHDRDRIDEAVRRQLPFASVEEILEQREVVLNERERQVLRTFWGTPL